MYQHRLWLDDTVITYELKICRRFLDRARGLLWRAPLSARRGQALLIPKCNSVHTFFMGYPLTVIFLDRDRRIVKICRRVKPWRIAFSPSARYVIECAVGTAWTTARRVGEQLDWQ